jgi:hypothetical protein
MAQYLNLTQVTNPVAQTIRITEPGGVVLTGVGLYFYSKPPVASPNLPINIEVRPVTEGGNPSGLQVYPGTITSKARADITASTTYDAATGETKFTFPSPLYVPANTEVALVIHTNAAPGEYQIWTAKMGDFAFGSTEKRITAQPYIGSFYSSANGTTWTPEQSKDLTFKLYQAKFRKNRAKAVFGAPIAPEQKLSQYELQNNPLFFTTGDSDVKVLHPYHGLLNGDTVRLTGLDSATTYSGVLGSSILGKRTIKNRDPYGYTITADSAADSDIRSGGNDILATGQLPFDSFKVNIPVSKTDVGDVKGFIRYKTFTPYGINTNGYQTDQRNMDLNVWQKPLLTGVVMNHYQESDRSITKGSLLIGANITTENENTAPYINAEASSITLLHNLIDNSDSNGAFAGANGYDSQGGNSFNKINTIDFVPETAIFGASALARHITKVVTLREKATSMRVYVDAFRPSTTEFSVWYRTAIANDQTPIGEVEWSQFSKDQTTANRSNYSDMATNDNYEFKEYYFTKFDLPEFDQFQVKIVMNSPTSYKVPMFKNLRIISTI